MSTATGLLIGSGVSGLSSLASGFAQASAVRSQAKFEARQLKTASRYATLQGEQAIRRGEQDVRQIGRSRQQIIGAQRASLAAQGIDIEEGTALQLQEETAALAAEDIVNRRTNAFLEAWGYRQQAVGLRSQAKFTSIAGRSQARSLLYGGAAGASRDFLQGAYLYNQYAPSSPSTGTPSTGGFAGASAGTGTYRPRSSGGFLGGAAGLR